MKDYIIPTKVISTIKKIAPESEIHPLETAGFIRIAIGSIDIHKSPDKEPETHLKPSVTGKYFKGWKEGVGGILFNELKKNNPELFVMKNNTHNIEVLLKRISKDENDLFESKKLNHFVINDESYTIIKIISQGCR